MRWEPSRRSPCPYEISPLELQCGLSELGIFWIESGHPFLEYSKSFLQIGPYFCAVVISSKPLSEDGSWSRMFSTQSSISSACLTRDVDLEGARDNASALVSSLPGTWEIVPLFRAFVPSSILGGESMHVVLLMMYASFATSNLSVGHIVLKTISAYCTGLFQLVACSFLSRSPRFRRCEAFHVYLTRVRSNNSFLFF